MFDALGDGPYYTDPAGDVLFGDIFEGTFFLDLFARADAALMGGGAVPPHLAPKVGAWMNEKLEEGDLDLFSPGFTPKQANRYALGHASFFPDADTHRAILISDSCLTATALAQGRQKRSVSGRLLFAPVRRVEQEVWEGLAEDVDFERFPLPPDDRLPQHSVVELRHSFMVEARAIKDYSGARIASLTPELAEELEAHWAAYATRRGPRAYERNTFKVAVLLAGSEQPEEGDEMVGDAIAAVLDLAWVLEGADLEEVSDAEEAVRLMDGDPGELTPPLLERVERRLRDLAGAAQEAAEAVAARR
ncbi:MAG: hypothetical protein ACRDM7_09980 [Thermoleophilaceae bacterium]